MEHNFQEMLCLDGGDGSVRGCRGEEQTYHKAWRHESINPKFSSRVHHPFHQFILLSCNIGGPMALGVT